MTLLNVVERALRGGGITASRLGREAVRDPRLVHDLRRGRQPGPRVTKRVLAFLAGAKVAGPTAEINR